MGKRTKRTDEESESSSERGRNSSSDEMSPRRCCEARRNTRKKEDKVIKKILEELTDEMRKQSKKLNESLHDTREMRKQLEKLTESHNDLCKKWDLSTNGTRSQPNQLQPPRYRLAFTPGDIGNIVEKGKNIEITVALVDVNNGRTVENGPLAHATVELVVVNAEFNQHDNQHNWSREDFERHIVTKKNSPTTNVCQSVKSIVSNGQFNLVHGVKCHSASTIFSNSSNKKVRLGVMVVLPTEERVLEGLSTSFFVRGHDRPNRQKKGQLPIIQNSSSPDSSLAGGFSVNISGGNNGTVPPQPHTSQEEPASIQRHQVPDLQMPAPDSFWECLLNSDLAGAFGTQFNSHESEYLMIIVPKEAKQTRGKRDLVIEPLEPDGSVEEVPLKRNLALFDHNTNITPTSLYEVLASAQEERTQGDSSEPFPTKDHSLAGQPLGSWFHRTDDEQTVQCQTEKNPRPKDAARCLASSRVAHLITSKPAGTDSISPRPKGPARCLAPAPPPAAQSIMVTARDVHPLALKPIGSSVRALMMSSVASNPTVTSPKGIALREHHMTSKETGPRVAGVTLPTMVWTMPSMAHLFDWKHMTRQDGSMPLLIKFGLKSHREWVHPKENIPLEYGTKPPTQISWMELSLTRQLCHVSRTHFAHHQQLLSSIPSPSSLGSHARPGRASTTYSNEAIGGNPCVLRRLMYPPPWCFSSVFVNGSRSVYDDCFYSSSDHASLVIHAVTGHHILESDLGSPLPPMETTERRGLHECMRSLAAGPGIRVHDETKSGTTNGRWSQVLDWRFFLGFSFV